MFLDEDIRERLDRLIAFLESQDGVCGNGTMLMLGDSVLYSRFDRHETRMVIRSLFIIFVSVKLNIFYATKKDMKHRSMKTEKIDTKL